MTIKKYDLIMDNKIFLWLFLGTLLLLHIPLMAMVFNWQIPEPGDGISDGVNWTLSDFIVMGTLLFSISSAAVLTLRKIEKKHRLLVSLGFLFAFLYIWAELAVGIFTNLGS